MPRKRKPRPADPIDQAHELLRLRGLEVHARLMAQLEDLERALRGPDPAARPDAYPRPHDAVWDR